MSWPVKAYAVISAISSWIHRRPYTQWQGLHKGMDIGKWESLGHLGGWLSDSSSYCPFRSLAPWQKEKTVVFFLPQCHTWMAGWGEGRFDSWASQLALKECSKSQKIHSYQWYLDENLMEVCKMSPDAARMPKVFFFFFSCRTEMEGWFLLNGRYFSLPLETNSFHKDLGWLWLFTWHPLICNLMIRYIPVQWHTCLKGFVLLIIKR